MTEAYTDLENTVKFYKYGAHVPFNFKFITDVTVSSKPNDFKKIIETWIGKMPEDSSANWVVSIIFCALKGMFCNAIETSS